jgi:release factor glutamine methyltransferase
MMTIRAALNAAKGHIAALDAQILLGHLLGVERAYLLGHAEQPLAPEQARQYEALVARCAAGEPLAYILGRRAFYDREFIVSPAVLVPRPETELLIEQTMPFVRQYPHAVVVDVGTGSGALAVTLAAHCPHAQVYATDISPAALDIAQQNAAANGVHVTFFTGDLLMPLIERGIRVDVLLANLPYVASGDLPNLAVSRYEPRLALDGGADGLDVIRRLLTQVPSVCNSGALILLEIGFDQGQAVQALARTVFPAAQITRWQDYADLDRVVCVQLND